MTASEQSKTYSERVDGLNVQTEDHVAALLPNGFVLLVGGEEVVYSETDPDSVPLFPTIYFESGYITRVKTLR